MVYLALLPRIAVILAAGSGTRIGCPKAVLEVHGYPLILYPLAVLSIVGVESFCIITRRDLASRIKEYASRILDLYDLTVVVNNEPERENGFSLLLAAHECPWSLYEPAFISMVDHIYPPLLAQRVAMTSSNRYYVIGGDREAVYVDVEEATKLLADASMSIVKLGKNISRWTHIDTGLHLARRFVVEYSYELLGRPYRVALNDLTSTLARHNMLYLADVSGIPWKDIDTREDLESIERGSSRIVLDTVREWIGWRR